MRLLWISPQQLLTQVVQILAMLLCKMASVHHLHSLFEGSVTPGCEDSIHMYGIEDAMNILVVTCGEIVVCIRLGLSIDYSFDT
jgi:hypothetical protein